MKDQMSGHVNAGPENEGPHKQDLKMEDKCNQWVRYHNRKVFYLSTVTEHTQIVHKRSYKNHATQYVSDLKGNMKYSTIPNAVRRHRL